MNFTKQILLIAMALMPIMALAQKKKTETTNESASTVTGLQKDNEKEYSVQRSIYKEAVRLEDFMIARSALYNMIALKPDVAELKDSLAILYYLAGAHVQTAVLCREIIEKNPNKAIILEILAESEEKLGLLKEALANFENLEKLSPKPYNKYKITLLQFALKRFGECAETAKKLLADSGANGEKVRITYDAGRYQDVAMKAAVLNILGLTAAELNQKEDAELLLQEALKLEPEFALAKMNLESITQQQKPSTPEKTENKTKK
jgi:tetratricopeptide (TPR) repeat protein